ncbi:alpha/beta fold hydrolase [Streptomyces sp. RLB3-17]|nr:alpha/beta fold hydrolase [Streptomyces sp. RLA2-12]QDN55468.1 alpha/beta fold hydrolase [Streptomyces sp. S1D4-20]QDN65646.1 alpha/beta fold hydrolase [Streptomyces sp. S1D4-14]QDN96290.1 alpha/beta fold hydrolase [Streptomyces sp. RLB1-9]QDO17999.1 alpha/beta fold hydrolase [Streptomyces sp. S1A1-8]QDO28126.1 alpha/beta fold hydrolase [Streptomyces sp. S1A1-3]QDO38014.1 alpha/beta fold hydrolase [Streptomyces sp. RLB3-17]QDO48051.1 alpha/beta fold hydrolase [Streptomyces sp. RLB3-5]QDO
MVPGLSPVRGVGVEASRAAVRLARLPLDMAAEGVGQLSGRLGRVMLWWSTEREEAPPTDSGIPVLLVHGLADGASVISPLRRGLRGCGASPFIPVSYNALKPDIRTAARALGAQVEMACARSAVRPVVVIGYSLGGLIARYYVQRLGGDTYVPLVITLATPHGGTATALLAPPHPLMRQLRPGSALLTELAEPAEGCRTRFVAFYSDLDEAVIPAARGRIDHPDLTARNVLVPGVGHLTLPLHKPVIDQVRSLLTAAQQATFTACPPCVTAGMKRRTLEDSR